MDPNMANNPAVTQQLVLQQQQTVTNSTVNSPYPTSQPGVIHGTPQNQYVQQFKYANPSRNVTNFPNTMLFNAATTPAYPFSVPTGTTQIGDQMYYISANPVPMNSMVNPKLDIQQNSNISQPSASTTTVKRQANGTGVKAEDNVVKQSNKQYVNFNSFGSYEEKLKEIDRREEVTLKKLQESLKATMDTEEKCKVEEKSLAEKYKSLVLKELQELNQIEQAFMDKVKKQSAAYLSRIEVKAKESKMRAFEKAQQKAARSRPIDDTMLTHERQALPAATGEFKLDSVSNPKALDILFFVWEFVSSFTNELGISPFTLLELKSALYCKGVGGRAHVAPLLLSELHSRLLQMVIEDYASIEYKQRRQIGKRISIHGKEVDPEKFYDWPTIVEWKNSNCLVTNSSWPEILRICCEHMVFRNEVFQSTFLIQALKELKEMEYCSLSVDAKLAILKALTQRVLQGYKMKKKLEKNNETHNELLKRKRMEGMERNRQQKVRANERAKLNIILVREDVVTNPPTTVEEAKGMMKKKKIARPKKPTTVKPLGTPTKSEMSVEQRETKANMKDHQLISMRKPEGSGKDGTKAEMCGVMNTTKNNSQNEIVHSKVNGSANAQSKPATTTKDAAEIKKLLDKQHECNFLLDKSVALRDVVLLKNAIEMGKSLGLAGVVGESQIWRTEKLHDAQVLLDQLLDELEIEEFEQKIHVQLDTVPVRKPPLGQDREFNSYYFFKIKGLVHPIRRACERCLGGFVFVRYKSDDGIRWRYYTSLNQIHQLMSALDVRGVRERDLLLKLRELVSQHGSSPEQLRDCVELKYQDKFEGFDFEKHKVIGLPVKGYVNGEVAFGVIKGCLASSNKVLIQYDNKEIKVVDIDTAQESIVTNQTVLYCPSHGNWKDKGNDHIGMYTCKVTMGELCYGRVTAFTQKEGKNQFYILWENKQSSICDETTLVELNQNCYGDLPFSLWKNKANSLLHCTLNANYCETLLKMMQQVCGEMVKKLNEDGHGSLSTVSELSELQAKMVFKNDAAYSKEFLVNLEQSIENVLLELHPIATTTENAEDKSKDPDVETGITVDEGTEQEPPLKKTAARATTPIKTKQAKKRKGSKSSTKSISKLARTAGATSKFDSEKTMDGLNGENEMSDGEKSESDDENIVCMEEDEASISESGESHSSLWLHEKDRMRWIAYIKRAKKVAMISVGALMLGIQCERVGLCENVVKTYTVNWECLS